MSNASYDHRRGQLEEYFDRTAVEAWAKLTSTAPVGRIRATVRAGRDEMRDNLLGWMPADLTGRSVLDAGCGSGALAMEAARRGADVVAIDLSATLVDLARERAKEECDREIDFRVGDMLDLNLGTFDHVVAMDSMIHYEAPDMLDMIAAMGALSKKSVLFTFAPRTRPLAVMHAVGQFFPQGNRSPAIVPISEKDLRKRIWENEALTGWTTGRSKRVSTGFYISHALEMIAPGGPA